MAKKPIDECLRPDPANANAGTERGLRMLDDSLRKYGAGRSILADKHGTIIAGNKTLEAAAAIGLPVQIIETDGTSLVVVRRTDLDLATDPNARELAYADNRVAEVDLSWSPEQLLADLDTGIDLDAFFSQKELDELLRSVRPAPPVPDAENINTLKGDVRPKRGDVFLCGPHRIMCGDATSREDVARLLSGAKPNLMVTDPPYGVNYDPNWRNEAAAEGHLAYAASRIGDVTNDDRVDWGDAWALFPGDILYTWSPGGDHVIRTGLAIESQGFEIRNQIIWSKSNFPISRGHYTYRHEPCWYAVRKGATANWVGAATECTIWEINLDSNVEGGHSTQKPLECMARPIRNHEGDVYDPFLGSGTTLCAAEQLGRVCYAMEIEPKYVEVSLRRWEQMTGEQATKESPAS